MHLLAARTKLLISFKLSNLPIIGVYKNILIIFCNKTFIVNLSHVLVHTILGVRD